jgi:carboxymethylenebutenolidase
MGTNIEFTQPNGDTCRDYLSSAAASDAPGVVVIQEWWGLQEQIKGLCDRFALAGFDALAPDLYNGTVVPYHDIEAAGREMASLDFLDVTDQKVRGAAQFLGRNGALVGLTGFCLGGAVTVIGCAKISKIAAGVVFYGIPPEEVVSPQDVRVPIQCHFASKDDWCTPELVDRFESTLKAAGKTFELYRYEAEHAFANEQRVAVHDRTAAELAWGRAADFLHSHLSRPIE